jgi:NAD+ synthase/NAD+ synthase (glutamine-hydrolysing)
VKVFLAQLNPTVGDLPGNAARIAAAMGRARDAGADLLVTAELSLPGYPPRDLVEKSSFLQAQDEALADLAAQSRGIEAIVGIVERNTSGEGRGLFNSAAVLREGRVVSTVAKSLLPTYDVFDEDRYFQPAARRVLQTLCGVPSGVTICEDAWTQQSLFNRRLYTADPIAELAGQGARVLFNVSASPFSLGRPALRERLLQEHARRRGLPLICVNQVGGNDELLFDGSSLVVDSTGRTRVRLASFREDERLVDLDRLVDLPEPPAYDPAPAEEALPALVMGTADYVRKCGFSSVVLGLSGGIDSAVTAAVAVAALGADRVHGVAMPARYSSPHSVEDARAVAEALGIDLRTIGIDGMFQSALDTVAPVFAGLPADVTEENLQARCRGVVLMALSNKFGWLVLTTGNKSEMAVGYCTLYGDMSGGLAVLSDVPKTLVYSLGRRINRDRVVIPEGIFSKPPSAELRPNQTDQDSLPPYETLDAILKLAVEEGRSAEAIAAAGFDPAVVRSIVERVDRNEYKRRQAAPGLRITSKAFGMGRRMPIAQGFTGR